MVCVHVGNSNPDIAGLGIIYSFVIQAGFSFVLSIWSATIDGTLRPLITGFRSFLALLRIGKKPDAGDSKLKLSKERQLQKLYIEKISATISDVQTINGISLLIGAMVQYNTLNLYHYHIIYDLVNLTGISVCAALINIIGTKTAHNRDRLLSAIVFICLYLAFVVIFGIKLQAWDDAKLGHCYNSNGLLSLGYYHSLGDRVYLAITCGYFFLSLIFCGLVALGSLSWIHEYPILVFMTAQQESLSKFEHMSAALSEAAKLLREKVRFSEPPPRRFGEWGKRLEKWTMPSHRLIILSLAMIQYPVHIYAVFTLRWANEVLLKGDSENYWGFGQVVALVLLASSVLEGLRAIHDYYTTKREGCFKTLLGKSGSDC